MANEFRDIGRDIRDALLDAVESGDFSQLNRRISRSVGDAIDEVNERLNGRGHSYQSGYDRNGYWNGTVREEPFVRTEEPTYAPKPPKQELQIYAQKPKGSLAGLLCTIFGGVFLGAFGIALLAVIAAFTYKGYFGPGFWISGGIFSFLTVGSGVLLGVGQRLRKRVKLFRNYVAVLKGKTYCAISELAQKLGKKEKVVLREIRKMIEQGMFPQGHIDDEEKTLLLTDGMYRQYQDLKRMREERAAQEEETPEQRLYRETVEQGKRYLDGIRRANDAIPGEAVSQKLFRLEDVVGKIFDQVRRNPQQIPELRRFLDYYMPTTLKLVETYQELDRHPVAGQNILKAKEEIEKTLDTINVAFENLFDSLFEHTAVDISSDISVLKTMLKQEGLTEKDFS